MLFRPGSGKFSGLLFTQKDSSKETLTFTQELNHEQANQQHTVTVVVMWLFFIAVAALFF